MYLLVQCFKRVDCDEKNGLPHPKSTMEGKRGSYKLPFTASMRVPCIRTLSEPVELRDGGVFDSGMAVGDRCLGLRRPAGIFESGGSGRHELDLDAQVSK